MKKRRGWRWFQRALAVVDPLAFADSVESYFAALPIDEVRRLAQHAVQRMSSAERAQFALYVDEQSLAKKRDDLLPRRLVAFFRENPRSVESLGSDALDRIFAPLETVEVSSAPKHELNWQAVGLAILVLIVAFVPLAAQYARQRGLVQGLADATMVPPLAIARVIAPPPKPLRHVAQRRAKPARMHVALHPRRVALIHRMRPLRARRHAVLRVRRSQGIAAVWKFDRRNYRYFNRPPKPVNFFQERARLAVQSYLDAVIAGNTRSALQHLGLPPDANLVNLSEVPIIARNSSARVVAVKPQANGNTQVEAAISGRRGKYLEVFYVAADGPALRITDRYYVPVGR